MFWKRKISTAAVVSDYLLACEQMVRAQLVGRNIKDTRVLQAMAQVPREEFVPDDMRSSAYDDRALPIGQDQTISQPYTVAFMLQALQLTGQDRVLEIGTGSGYGAAVISRLVRHVDTVERLPALVGGARERLRRLGYHNVTVHLADGTLGLAEYAPFDAIVVTAGAKTLPPAYAEQLGMGGRIVIPIGSRPRSQTMTCYTRGENQWRIEKLGGFAFVPLIGEQGWPTD